MIASECPGKWLKDHPHASQVHRVLRYDGEWLVTYCGRRFQLNLATKANGIPCCPECYALLIQQQAEKRQALAEKYPHKRKRLV